MARRKMKKERKDMKASKKEESELDIKADVDALSWRL